MKNIYESPNLEITTPAKEDIITASEPDMTADTPYDTFEW